MDEQVWFRRDIVPGAPVYARHGAFLGRVEAVGHSVLRVMGTGPLAPVFYVPRGSVLGILPGGATIIDVTRDAIEDMGWKHPPDLIGGTQLER